MGQCSIVRKVCIKRRTSLVGLLTLRLKFPRDITGLGRVATLLEISLQNFELNFKIRKGTEKMGKLAYPVIQLSVPVLDS
jgi:hypothetical protein